MTTQPTSRLFRIALAASAFIVAVAVSMAASAPPQHEHPPAKAHHHPAAAKLKNPVATNAASISGGRKLYEKHCSECHGENGKGDGDMGEDMEPKPANLADADWKHGSTDGEIFTVIRDGVKSTGMKAYGKKMTAHQIWDVVNYMRSIGPAKSH